MRLKKFKFKKVNSTNNTAIRIIKNSNFKFGMVTADTQLSGKGQYGKKWISNKGNLFVSFFHEIKNINISLSTLTKINCLLVKKTIEKYYKKKIVFKKPNDLLINKKKISGILQEIISVSGNEFLIVGIGVNLIKSPKIKNINRSISTLTKINCLLVKKTIEKYYKKKIVFKKPNDLLINKKKISGILQEIISVSGNKFLIVGIGVNLIKSPKIKNYPTTNLSELINKPINKINFENELKVLFVKNLSRMYKINNKVNKK